MESIKGDLKKRYKKCMLEAEIYLWQIHILEHPDDKECYENAIADNIRKLIQPRK